MLEMFVQIYDAKGKYIQKYITMDLANLIFVDPCIIL
jgi:hypothetical protein